MTPAAAPLGPWCTYSVYCIMHNKYASCSVVPIAKLFLSRFQEGQLIYSSSDAVRSLQRTWRAQAPSVKIGWIDVSWIGGREVAKILLALLAAPNGRSWIRKHRVDRYNAGYLSELAGSFSFFFSKSIAEWSDGRTADRAGAPS